MAKYTEITISSIDATAFELPDVNTHISISTKPTITLNLVAPNGIFIKPVTGLLHVHSSNSNLETLSGVTTKLLEIDRVTGKIRGTRVGNNVLPTVILNNGIAYSPGMVARFIPDTCVATKNFNISSKIINDSFIENLVTRDKLELIMECGYQKIGSGIKPQDCHHRAETFTLPSEGDETQDVTLVTGVEINHEPKTRADGVIKKKSKVEGSMAELLITDTGFGYQAEYPPVMEFYSIHRVTEVASAALFNGGTANSSTITITLAASNPDIQVNQIVTGGNIGSSTTGTIYVEGFTPGKPAGLRPQVDSLVYNGNLQPDIVKLGGDGYRCHPPHGKGEPTASEDIGIDHTHIVVKIDVSTIANIGVNGEPWTNILPNQFATGANLAGITPRNTAVIVTCVSEKYIEKSLIDEEGETFKCLVTLTNPNSVARVQCS